MKRKFISLIVAMVMVFGIITPPEAMQPMLQVKPHN